MRTIYRLPAAVALAIGFNVAGNVASADPPPSDPGSTFATPEGPCEWVDCPLPEPDPDPEPTFEGPDDLSIEPDDPCQEWGICPPGPDPEVNPDVDGPDDVTTEPDDPCDLWGHCPPPPVDPCEEEPFVADDLVAPGVEAEVEIDDLVANPCVPDEDDDDPDDTPDEETCVLDEICTGDPTFTG